jgi:hypothetical protein
MPKGNYLKEGICPLSKTERKEGISLKVLLFSVYFLL